MIHPGLAALEKWDTIEYAAGYPNGRRKEVPQRPLLSLERISD
jgi:hypothetical protein